MLPEKKTVFLLVRHGQTEANAQEMISGNHESPLTEVGERQMRALAEGLRQVEFDVVFSSSLARARRSCEILVDGRGCEPIVLDSLREQDFGEWEGTSYRKVMDDDPDAFAEFRVDPVRARAPGGESLAEFVERVRGALFDDMIGRHQGKRILAVAHGGTIRVAINLLLGLDIRDHFYRYDIQNATLTVVRYGSRGGRLVGLGLLDPSHLKI